MVSKIKISVIIPVYNVEKYLDECIMSVLKQDYGNIEIILVDDGSTDKSPLICDKYANEHAHIMVIHKENGGSSDARNAGIAIASGDYIIFLDSDDFWNESNAISCLVRRLHIFQSDVLNFSYTKFFEDTNKTEPYIDAEDMPLPTKLKAEQLRYIFKNNLYIASAWNKLIKRELFDHELFFEVGVYSEDIEWCAKLLSKAQSFDFVSVNFHYYRQHSHSISHTINDKKCSDLCSHIISCISMAHNEIDECVKKYLYNYISYQFGTFFVVQALAQNVQNICIEKLKSHTWILSYHNGNKKLIALNILCKLLGYVNTCKIIRLLYKKRRK